MNRGKFGIKVSNEKELYDSFSKSKYIEFEGQECKDLEWVLSANIIVNEAEGFEITTIIKKKKKEYIPKAELKKELSSYEIFSETNHISFYDEEYFCSVENEGRRFILSTEYYSGSFEDFKKMLSANNELLEKVVKAYCTKNKLEVPEFEYTLNTSKIKEDELLKENPYYKSFENEIEIKDFSVKFEDIGGNIDGKKEMLRIYRDIAHPELAVLFGRDPSKSKGYLLYGGKGNGKTMLVQALATKLHDELNDKMKFYIISYGTIASTLRGGEAENIKLLFKLVEMNEKKGLTSIVFMDELQSVALRDQFNGNEALDELLANLGGMNSYKKSVFIGASYCPIEQLDSALIRPGRLGKHIEIKAPNVDERKEIMQIYLNKEKNFAKENAGFENLFGTINLDLISKETEAYNGSDIMMLFEQVSSKKEEEILSKFKEFDNLEEIKAAITPIETNDFLEITHKGLKKSEPNLYT